MSDGDPLLFRPDRFVHGLRCDVVIVPRRVAAWLEARTELPRLRRDSRGEDSEVAAVLLALSTAAQAWRDDQTRRSSAAIGTGRADVAEPVAPFGGLTVTQAAARLDVTTRAIRKAIADGRLVAEKTGRAWLIDPAELAHYEAARAA
jgi:excisionase family DNA binding protein